MTLEEHLKGIEKRSNPYDKDVKWLIAAIKQCRQQRNSYFWIASTITHCGRSYIEADDDELLSILEGTNKDG